MEAGEMSEFYTFGYGRTTDIEDFIQSLHRSSVETLVDIRDSPKSRFNPPFSQTPLKKALKENSIEYVHIPELGVPKTHRNNLKKQSDYDALWKWYDSTRIPKLWPIIKNIKESYPGHYVLMCAESNPQHCHRHRIAKAFNDEGSKCEEVLVLS